MSVRGLVAVAVAATVALGACATTGVNGGKRARETRVEGSLMLSNGKALPKVALALICGERTLRAKTDARGRFVFSRAPAAQCELAVVGTAVRKAVDLGDNLMRPGAAKVRLTIPPARRITYTMRWKGDGDAEKVDEVVLDDTLPAGSVLAKALDTKPEIGKSYRLLARRTPVRLTVKKVEERVNVPLRLRSEPRDADVMAIPLQKVDEVVNLGALFGERTVVWVGKCKQLTDALIQDFAALEKSYGRAGLRAVAVTTDPCKSRTKYLEDTALPPRWTNVLGLGGGGAVLKGSREVLWALGARDGELLVLGRDASVLWRRHTAKGAPVQSAISFLTKNWSSFAAADRVSVKKGDSISSAKEDRLLVQAERRSKAGDFSGAKKFLDQVLSLSPTNAEARKQRALASASLGDVTGAVAEVAWWRRSFGDESADELMEQIKRRSKVTALK